MKNKEKPDLEGVRMAREEVGGLPVPRSIRMQKGESVGPVGRAPIDEGSRRRGGPAPRQAPADLRSTLPRAARTPEQLGRALGKFDAGDKGR